MAHPDEHWEGSIDLPGHPLRIRVHLLQDGGSLDVPGQLASGLPLDGVKHDGDHVSFAVPTLPGAPRFDGTRQAGAIRGTFTQGGTSAPFELVRGAGNGQQPRPQDPRPPLPYETQDVEIDHGSFTLAGTMTVPEGHGVPGVLLVSGSGSLDRDESIADHRPFLVLADALTRNGCAVLRIDDPGVGRSGGERGPMSYEDLADIAVINLRRLARHPSVDGSRLGIVGHSQGGNVATITANRSCTAGVRGVVLLASPALEGRRILTHQTEAILKASGLDAATVGAEMEHLARMIETVMAGDLETATRLHLTRLHRQSTDGADGLDSSARDAVEVLRHVIDYDPTRDLQELAVPALAIYGTLDLQVAAAQNADQMRSAIDHLKVKQVVVLEGLNHLMQPAGTGLPSEYAEISTTIDPKALATITDWLRRTL